MISNTKKNIALFLLPAMFFCLDRILKYFALNNYTNTLIENILEFGFFKNYFIAFSLPIGGLAVKIVSSIILVVILLLLLKVFSQKNIYFFPLALLFWGSLSNFIDRVSYNFVIDYLNFFNFSILNLADIIISVALLIIVYFYFLKKREFI